MKSIADESSRSGAPVNEQGWVEMRSKGSHRYFKHPNVILEVTATGYSAYSPDVSGCAAVGDTKERTRRNFQDALAAHFQAMREVGEPIPEPNSSVDYVEVAA